MDKLKQYIKKLDIRQNAEERLLYQIVDLELVKYKGVQSGEIVPGDEIYQAMEQVIAGFLWLYEKGLSLETSVKDKLAGEDLEHYLEFMNAFNRFNEFMQTHMHLKG